MVAIVEKIKNLWASLGSNVLMVLLGAIAVAIVGYCVYYALYWLTFLIWTIIHTGGLVLYIALWKLFGASLAIAVLWLVGKVIMGFLQTPKTS